MRSMCASVLSMALLGAAGCSAKSGSVAEGTAGDGSASEARGGSAGPVTPSTVGTTTGSGGSGGASTSGAGGTDSGEIAGTSSGGTDGGNAGASATAGTGGEAAGSGTGGAGAGSFGGAGGGSAGAPGGGTGGEPLGGSGGASAGGVTGGAGAVGTGGTGAQPSATGCNPPQPSIDPPNEYVVGNGTPTSCTSTAIQAGLDQGARVVFDCGPGPVTISVTTTLRVASDSTAALDGDGRITLDGQNARQILVADNRATLGLRGLTFVRGRGVAFGSAVEAGNYAVVEVLDCVFDGSHVAGDRTVDAHPGGALAGKRNSRVTVVRSTFRNNTCDAGCYGGAAFYVLLGDSQVFDSRFEDNRSEGSFGGAAYVENGPCCYDEWSAYMTHWCGNTFIGNQGAGRGGAISVYFTRTLIERCHFEDNSSGQWGGALSLSSADGLIDGVDISGQGDQIVRSSSFVNNRGPKGGALWTIGTERVIVESSTFTAHPTDGGANSVIFRANSTNHVRASHVTIAHNAVPAFWETGDTGTITVTGSLLIDNGPGNGSADRCADVFEFPTANSSCAVGAVSIDPDLGALETRDGLVYFPLPADSPALAQSQTCPATDQLSTPRTSPCDLGAFELP